MAVALRSRPFKGRVVPGAPRAGRSRAVFPNPVILAEIGWARQLAARLPLMTLRPTENTDLSIVYSAISGLQCIRGESRPSHQK